MEIVGILGGMGPMAAMDLSVKIIKNTKAKSDNDHIHVLIDNNCEIPDRTSYILGKGKNPINQMISSIKKLEGMGADFIVMPCNTAHYFYNEIKEKTDLPFINMILETAKEIKVNEIVGLMATRGTYEGKVYEDVFIKENINLKIPNESIKKDINKIIYDYKSGVSIKKEELDKIVKYFEELGVHKLILGCTELPIIFKDYTGSVEFVDPTDILSKRTVELAGKELVS